MSRFINGDLVLDSSFYSTTTVTLDSGFTGGSRTLRLTRIGNVVTATLNGVATYTAGTTKSTSAGLIPAGYRPLGETWVTYANNATTVWAVIISSAGTLTVSHRDWAGGTASIANTGSAFTISYAVE
jgi:hypothetical protein